MNADGWATMNGRLMRLSKSGDEAGLCGRIPQAEIKRKCDEFFKSRGMERVSTFSFGSVRRRKAQYVNQEDDDELENL
jgi:hypothetical protein